MLLANVGPGLPDSLQLAVFFLPAHCRYLYGTSPEYRWTAQRQVPQKLRRTRMECQTTGANNAHHDTLLQ